MRHGSRRGRGLVALFAMVCAVAAGCDSAVVPPSTGPGPMASVSTDPLASGEPSSTDPGASSSADPATPSGTVAPSPDFGLPELSSLAMPGFAAYEQVQMIGSEFAVTVYTALSCDALAGWLQAADWRLDGSFAAPLPSLPPAEGAIVPPNTRWLVISRPGEAAVAKLVSDGDDTGCRASVSRLSEQPLSASGAFTTTTDAMAYQMICLPDTVSAHVVAFYLADDGTRAMISAKVPLALGEQNLLDAELRIGAGTVTISDIAESFAGSLGTLGFLERLDGLVPYEGVYETSTGTAIVTSIDPLVATVTLGNFIGETGASQSVSAAYGATSPKASWRGPRSRRQ